MLTRKYWLVSIIISILGMIGIFYQNFRIAELFLASQGKTRAMFGLIEMGQLDKKVGLGILLLIAFVLGLLSKKRQDKRAYWISAIIICIVAFGLLFCRLWLSMINSTQDGFVVF